MLLPTPPKISKKERRELFEAQIKAKDEMQKQQLQQLHDPAPAYQYYQPQGFIDYQGQVDYPVPVQPGNHEVMYQEGAGMPVVASYQDGSTVIPMPAGPSVPMATPAGILVASSLYPQSNIMYS